MDCQCIKGVNTYILFLMLASGIACSTASGADTTYVIEYHGVVAQANTPYNGVGHFKFAIIDDPIVPSQNIWTHDGSNPDPGREPAHGISVKLEAGRFHVSLGDTYFNNISTSNDVSLKNADVYLRIWFSADGNDFVQLSPDMSLSDQTHDFGAGSANIIRGISLESTAQIIGAPRETPDVFNAAALTARE